MLTKKHTFFPKFKRKKLVVNLSGGGDVKMQSCERGAVRGSKIFSLPEFRKFADMTGVKKFCLASDYRIYFCRQDGLYVYDPRSHTTQLITREIFGGSPIFFHDEKANWVYVSGDSGVFYADEENFLPVLQQKACCFAYFRERFFCVDGGDRLFFTDVDHPHKWQQNYIQLPGNCYAVSQASDGILVFGQNLYKVQFDQSRPSTRVTLVAKNIPKVFPKTVATTCGVVMFLTEHGLCCYKQGKVHYVATDFKFHIQNDDAFAGAQNGKYYFAFRSAQEPTDCLAAFDVVEGRIDWFLQDTFCGMDFSDGMPVLLKDGELWSFSETPSACVWKSCQFDCGVPYQMKRIRQVELDSDDKVQLTIFTERDEHIYYFGGDGRKKFRTNVCGRVFSVEIHGYLQDGLSKIVLDTVLE